mgnify:CR=1 FL=1
MPRPPFTTCIRPYCFRATMQTMCLLLFSSVTKSGNKILLEDMGTSRSDEDLYLMKKTRLNELLEDEKQRMVYVFDPLDNRMFFIELTEISFGKTQEQPVCSRSHGEAPQQSMDLEEFLNKETTKPSEDLNEDFYGSESFDTEEFDPEGFEISEGNPYH